MSSITNNPLPYEIVGYQENSISTYFEVGPGPWDDSLDSSYANHARRITGPESIGPRLRATVLAANKIFQDRGSIFAYSLLLSPDMSSSEILRPSVAIRLGRLSDNPPLTTTNHVRFLVGDIPLISSPFQPFSVLQGYTLYNRLVMANRMYLGNVLSINSIGLGEYILQKMRTLPAGPERQQLVMCMVYLLANGFFTNAFLNERYMDLEAAILTAQREGCLHTDILPFPHVSPVLNIIREENIDLADMETQITNYPPMTDLVSGELPGIQRIGPGNCRYLSENFSLSHLFNVNNISQRLHDPADLSRYVTDEDIAANRADTERVLAKILNESE